MNTEGSKAFALNTHDLLKIGKNALLVGGAAALTVLAQNLHVIDLGVYGPVVVPVATLGIETLIRWMKDNTK